MNSSQMVIWAATALALVGVALAFFRSERTAVRLGALGAFAVFYFAVLLWGPFDRMWFNLTTGAVLVIALAARMRTRPPEAEPAPPAADHVPDEPGDKPA